MKQFVVALVCLFVCVIAAEELAQQEEQKSAKLLLGAGPGQVC